MALIKCPQCGKEISDKARKCPNCGTGNKSANTLLGKKILNKNIKIIITALAIVTVTIILGLSRYDISNQIYRLIGTCLFHKYEDATCTEAKRCKMCGKMKGSPLGHTYIVENKMDADCIYPGHILYVCDVCGNKYTEEIAALGHDFSSEPEIFESTCLIEGKRVYHCSRCDVTDEEIIPTLPHDWQDASCTTEKICIKCGTIGGEKLGHTTLAGICERCGKEIVEPITFSGNGDTVLKDINIPMGIYKIYLQNSGKSNFIVCAYNGDGSRDCWANEIGNYTGYVTLNYTLVNGMIEVQSSGEWKISISLLSDEGTSNLRGNGDCVTPLFNVQTSHGSLVLTHNGDRNFIVNLYDEDGKRFSSLANEIGHYNGERAFHDLDKGKRYYLMVEADGEWTIDFGEGKEITVVSNCE